jgi:acetyltransferase-like isoleucine patch superfamily enzyme
MSLFPSRIEPWLLRAPQGVASRVRVALYVALGLRAGRPIRMERGRIRRCSQVEIGRNNAFSEGWQLWPIDAPHSGVRIRIGDDNYFNRNVFIDACGSIEIGNENQFGPDVYVTDSNHRHGPGIVGKRMGMDVGRVRIGNGCWIGAKAVILMNVELGDGCVVGAGAVVTRSFPAESVVVGVPARPIGTSVQTMEGNLR